MSIKDNHSRRVTFDTGDEMGDKIGKLIVMIGRLAARDSEAGRQFKPQIYQGERRGQNRGSYESAIMISNIIKIDIVQKVETEDSTDKIEEDQGMNKIIEEEILEVM